MNTEKFLNYITAQIISQLENRLDAEMIVDVKNEEEVRAMLGEKFWDALTRPEQKIVLVDLYEKHMKDDVSEVSKFFNIIKFYNGRKWYSKDFFKLMDELMDKHMLIADDTLEYDVNQSLQDILGFELLITFNKEERELAKNFLDDYAYEDWGNNHFIRVDDGIYRFEKDLMN